MLRLPFNPFNLRLKVCNILCSASIEHAESQRILLNTGNFTSAIGLLRLQFEAVVRALWIVYAASDTSVKKFSEGFTNETALKNENMPMLSEMLKKLEERAPKNALIPLLEFKEYSWKPLSSFVHGGKHLVNRHAKGYPVDLLEQTLKASNGLNGFTGYFLAILSGDQKIAKNFFKTWNQFKDCLPPDRA